MESDGAKTPTSPRAQSADEQSGPEDDAREKDSNRKLLPKRSTLEKKSTKAILIEKKVQEEFGKVRFDQDRCSMICSYCPIFIVAVRKRRRNKFGRRGEQVCEC